MNKSSMSFIWGMLIISALHRAYAVEAVAPQQTPEQAKIIQAWQRKAHGRPVIINWTHMTIRSNQSPEMSGERMLKKFSYMISIAKQYQIPTTFLLEHQVLLDKPFCTSWFAS